MRLEINALASSLFNPNEKNAIQEICIDYTGCEEDYLKALSRLRYVVPRRPKRPMYYINHEVGWLPEHSRFVVEQSGSYVDLLLKEYRFELLGTYVEHPLGKNVEAIRNSKLISDDETNVLLNQLLMFNRAAYVPAKHIYGPPTEENHYFCAEDSIFIIFGAVKLGEEIKKRSQYARNLCQDLVLPGQGHILGNHPRTDSYGTPFDFTKRLLESNTLNLDIWGNLKVSEDKKKLNVYKYKLCQKTVL